MTQREFFNKVIEANVNDELTTYARGALEKLDKRNATRKSKPTKSQEANNVFKTEIAEFLAGTTDYVLGATIADHFGVTTQKATGYEGTQAGQAQWLQTGNSHRRGKWGLIPIFF